jgi:hypothetical protein
MFDPDIFRAIICARKRFTNQKEVKIGTVNGVLRQAGIPPDDFKNAL